MTRSRHPSLTKLRTSITPQPASAGSSPTSGSSRKRQPSGSPTQYRVEERTRTIYVQSEVHPSLWSPDTLDQMFDLASPQSSAPAFSPEHVHRSRSWTEKQIFVFPEGSEAASYPSSPLKPTSASYSRRPSRSEGSMPSSSPRDDFDNSRRSPLKSRQKILFYHKHDPYYGFTNFSSHPVVYGNRTYPTSEHLFQSFKFHGHRPNLAEHIRTCSDRPSVAFSEARRFQPEVRKDWIQVNIQKMEETLFYKFTQHPDLLHELLATGDAELVEDSDKDSFWGIGADGKGRNELGKALERLRAQLRGN